MSEAVRVVGEVVDEVPADGGWLFETAAPLLALPPDGPPLPRDPLSPPYPPAHSSPLGGPPAPEPPGSRLRKRSTRPTRQLALVDADEHDGRGSAKQALVAWYVDEVRRVVGFAPPSRTVGHYAKEIGKLVDEGVPARSIALGIRRQVEKGVSSPASLGRFAIEAARAETGPPRKLTAADVLRMAGDL